MARKDSGPLPPWHRAVIVRPPAWDNPFFIVAGPLEAKMVTCWDYPLHRWREVFFETAFGWRPVFRRWVGGGGRHCYHLMWGWFSFHWLGGKAKRRRS